ncbi:MarR family transcriptional regulator [Kitasatospora viridis]|uniref:MarR family protein n=1 Tax=Kitasatospora viridis TaxID=281105 RepID=A0A561SEC3_9ACTN|nr:helix-turn-helix domain-containing protein [Kitasatospora viridis]TWF73210.1 MarR family protein [Kitasatospora viridis]
MPPGRLTQQERQQIAAGLTDRLSFAEIARRLDRPTSTVSREVARNGGAGGYRPEQAHRATVRRARRHPPVPPRAGTPADPAAPTDHGDLVREIVELAVRSGMPRMTARVHLDLMFAEDGRRTAAELTERLRVSPASVSAAVNSLVEFGYVRRERDPRRRRDVYLIDDQAWYHSVVVSARQTLETAEAALSAARSVGPGTPVGRRLARCGAFLAQVAEDLTASADRRRPLLG